MRESRRFALDFREAGHALVQYVQREQEIYGRVQGDVEIHLKDGRVDHFIVTITRLGAPGETEEKGDAEKT